MPHTRERETQQGHRDAKYRGWDEYVDDETDAGPDAANAFRDLVQRDPTVCDNCFSLLFSRETHEWWRGSFGWVDYERWIPYPDKVADAPANETSQGTTLVCAECGHGRTKNRPIPKRLMRDYAENICEVLDRKGIEFDRRVVLHEVSRRNTSANQGRQDSDVFAPAVERGIQAERW